MTQELESISKPSLPTPKKLFCSRSAQPDKAVPSDWSQLPRLSWRRRQARAFCQNDETRQSELTNDTPGMLGSNI